jgi:hypothetical protein
MAENDAARRWTRALSALRARALRVRRTDAGAASTLDEILTESLETADRVVQELAPGRFILGFGRRGSTRNAERQTLDRCRCRGDRRDGRHSERQSARGRDPQRERQAPARLLLHFAADRDAARCSELPLNSRQAMAHLPA